MGTLLEGPLRSVIVLGRLTVLVACVLFLIVPVTLRVAWPVLNLALPLSMPMVALKVSFSSLAVSARIGTLTCVVLEPTGIVQVAAVLV